MNTNISLNQGKKFNNYQSRIKKNVEKTDPSLKHKNKSLKEGFTNVLEVNKKYMASVDLSNTSESLELQKLKSQFDTLVKQYNDAQSLSTNDMNQLVSRYNSNPYAGKNLGFSASDGAFGYVTQLGDFKWYGNPDMVDSTAGKNGCPSADQSIGINNITVQYNTPNTIINTSPSLIVGTPMVARQSCGNEGSNVYVNSLINNPVSTYLGCYNDKPAPIEMNIVPIMNSSNSVNGFLSYASSVYLNNNDLAGPWFAFDQNINTIWHSEVADGFLYDAFTGAYLGTNNTPYGVTTANGEWLQINMPNLSQTVLTRYSIQGRQGCCGDPNGRDPNTWYLLGYGTDGQWHEIDYQENQEFNFQMKTYDINNPQAWGAYRIVITVCGSSGDKTGNRYCVQIATWNLFTSSDYSFNDSDRSMIMSPLEFTTLDRCEKYAGENGYQYFGMQNMQSDGTASCLVSNDEDKSTSYGDASKIITGIPLWQTNTSGNNNSYITTAGSYCVNDAATGGIIWETDNKPGECFLGGLVNLYSITGSYGGNCVGKPVGIDCGNPSSTESYGTNGIVGNLNTQLKNVAQQNFYSSTSNFSYAPLSEFTGEDPAFCCAKMVDYTYQCGGGGAFKSGSVSGGTNINFDCSAEAATCNFFLILQDDGNMCLYRGTGPTDNQGAIWCSKTNGQQKDPNPEWVATKGKTGVNYLVLGQGLNAGEWIGSSDGSLKLFMQTDGNLVLFTSTIKDGCTQGKDGNFYGTSSVNALYKLDTIGNPASMGKVAYINSDAYLKEYPSSMITQSNEYDVYAGYDSGGNDINTLKSQDIGGCETACNSDLNCYGYVWQPSTTTCYLKNNNIYPKGPRQVNNSLTLGVRKPSVNSCSNVMTGIDTVQYDNYVKGDNMTSDTVCDGRITSAGNIKTLEDLENKLVDVSQQILNKINKLNSSSTNLNDTMNQKEVEMNNNIKMYDEVQKEINYLLGNKKIKNTNKIMNNNMVEGLLNMQDLNAMVSDSDLIVLQDNYQYILWTILAIGIICITIKTLQK